MQATQSYKAIPDGALQFRLLIVLSSFSYACYYFKNTSHSTMRAEERQSYSFRLCVHCCESEDMREMALRGALLWVSPCTLSPYMQVSVPVS